MGTYHFLATMNVICRTGAKTQDLQTDSLIIWLDIIFMDKKGYLPLFDEFALVTILGQHLHNFYLILALV